MRTWKTPDDYLLEVYTCNYDIKENLGCTRKFHELGFFKNGRWDYYSQYQTLCKNCDYFSPIVGVYFEDGKHTDNIQSKEIVVCHHKISTQEQLLHFVSLISKSTKTLIFNDIRTENLLPLQNLQELECVIISYCPKLNSFWDFQSTPHLKVLKYNANKHLTDITQICNATNLEYFEIDILTSQINFNHVQSFEPLTKLTKLKEVVLRGVTCLDNNIENLINIPNLEKLWISPNTFYFKDFAKFEALKFKIFEEYGIFQNGDFSCPLGKGERVFRSAKSKETFKQKYNDVLSTYKK